MKKLINNEKSKIIFIFFEIILLSLIPVYYTWGKLAIGGDIIIPLHSSALQKYLYQWINVNNGQYLSINYYPLYLFYRFVELFGLNIYQISGVLLFILDIISGYGIYVLVKLIYKSTSWLLTIPILFYLLSPALFNRGHFSYIYAFAPWFIYVLIKILRNNRFRIGDTVCLSVLIFLCSLDLPNPKYLFYLAVISLTMIIFSVLFKLLPLKKMIRFIPSMVLLLILTGYLWLPLTYFANQYRAENYNVKVLGKQKDEKMIDTGVSTFDRVVTLYTGKVLNKVDQLRYEQNKVIGLLGYIFSLVVILNSITIIYNLVLKKNGKEDTWKYETIIFFLALIFFFFTIGPNPPLGDLYKNIVVNNEVLGFLRTTAGANFFLSIFYAILIYGWLSKQKRFIRPISLCIVIAILTVGYPFWNGEYYKNFNNANPYTNFNERGFTIPSDYWLAKEKIEDRRLYSRTLHSRTILTYINTQWGFFGPVIYNFLYNNYNIGFDNVYTNYAYHNIGFDFIDSSTLNNPHYQYPGNTEEYWQSNFIEIKKVSSKDFLPRIYTTDLILVANEPIPTVFPIASTASGWQNRSAIYQVPPAGINSFTMALATISHLIEPKDNNLSFEKGLWNEKVYDCTASNPGKAVFDMKLATEATDGKYSLELTSGNHNACTLTRVPVTLNAGKTYRFSFDARSLKGGYLGYYVNVVGVSQQPSEYKQFKPIDNNWKKYEAVFTPKEDARSVEIYLYSVPEEKSDAINRFDNIAIDLVENRLSEGETKNNPINSQLPILEYKKINPTKYLVKVHQAKTPFSLVLSENFHPEWKVYLAKSDNRLLISDKAINSYQIEVVNEGEQASTEEVKSYIDKGWVTEIPNAGIQYISKNFSGSIQNENLSNSIRLNRQLGLPSIEVNGYANSWIIDPKNFCTENKPCDFELLIEFRPQRIFDYTARVALVFFILCTGYLLMNYRNKGKMKLVNPLKLILNKLVLTKRIIKGLYL